MQKQQMRRRALYGALALLLAAVTGWCVAVAPPIAVGTNAPAASPTDPVAAPVKGVWINCWEWAPMISGHTRAEYEQTLEQTLPQLVQTGFNTVFLQVRAFCDAMYPSDLFGWSSLIDNGAGVAYDPFALFLQHARRNGLAVHAWVNPYRVTNGVLDDLPANHVARKLAAQGAAVQTEQGVWLKPSHAGAQKLILQGVRELLARYHPDGIQFDDYFYPTTDPRFDEADYAAYCEAAAVPLSLADWRRGQVNALIAATCRLAHQYGAVFGVSPAAGLTKNREQAYADAAAWAAGGYVDYLCPQLYFGFAYPKEEYRFANLLSAWRTAAGKVPLYVGLAAYKLGQPDAGSTEWVTATDLLARQTEYATGFAQVQGVCVYGFSALTANDALHIKQRKALALALAQFIP